MSTWVAAPTRTQSYTPAADYNGPDSFTYRIRTPGGSLSNTATARITVNPVNDPPTAVDDTSTTAEDTLLSVAAPGVLGNDTDPDGTTGRTVQVVTGPTPAAAFTLSADGSVSYTPSVNYNGPDSFTYKVIDAASAQSNTATVRITVTPVDDTPTAVDDIYTTAEDTVLGVAAPGVLANDTDPDGTTLGTVELITAPTRAAAFTLSADGAVS